MVHLAVRNTVPFVPEELVGSLQAPFVRGAGRTSGAGRGLALAITASIIDAHAGAVTLTPNDDGGLLVDLRLPPA